MSRLRLLVMLIFTLSVLTACGTESATKPTVTPPATAQSESLQPRATVTPASSTSAATSEPPSSTAPATAVPAVTTLAPASAPQWMRPLALEQPRLQGADVKLVQQRLLDLGYAEVGEADGIFGPKTANGVILFQLGNNLPQSNVVDEQTWNRLFSDEALSYANDSAASSGRIVYLKPDGRTVVSINPDGEDEQPLPIVLDEDQQIYNISADPTGTYMGWTVSMTNSEEIDLHILKTDGTLLSTYSSATQPRWSPDGTRYVANVLTQSGDVLMIVMATEREDEAGPIAQFPGYAAAWSADGSTIIFVNDNTIYTYNLESGETIQVTNLPIEGDDGWEIGEAHFSPDGKRIYFYAGQRQNLGVSGNGMQWWIMPSAGGSAGCSLRFEGCGEPVAFTAPNGNGVGEFAFNSSGGVFAYEEGFHLSACASSQNVFVRTTADEESPRAAFGTNAAAADGREVRGLAWDASGTRLVIGFAPYRCSADFGQQFNDPPGIYVWNIGETGEPTRIADGSYPVWIK